MPCKMAPILHTRESLLSEVYPDFRLTVHKWSTGDESTTGAAVCVYHGYGAHGQYPTVRYAAELLAGLGHVVYAVDFPGHGESPGVRGLVREPRHLTSDGAALASHVAAKHPRQALVLLGASMGGAVALNVARALPVGPVAGGARAPKARADAAQAPPPRAAGSALRTGDVAGAAGADAAAAGRAEMQAAADDVQRARWPAPAPEVPLTVWLPELLPPPPPPPPLPLVAGCVLLAPMLGVPASSLPPPWKRGLLRGLACLAPGAAILGSNASDLSVQYRDEARRAECAADELSYGGAMRLATAASCLDLAAELRASLEEVAGPFLCLAAGDEAVVDPDGPADLLARASTPVAGKRLVTYPGARHGLLCEPEAERSAVEGEIAAFVRRMADAAAAANTAAAAAAASSP